MTLQSGVLVVFSAMLLMVSSAGAQIRPGAPRPIPSPQPPPVVQPSPAPPIPGIGNGGGGSIGHGGQNQGMNEQRVINVFRRVSNEMLWLRQLADLDRYNGYVVQAVTVNVRTSNYQSELRLVVNNVTEARHASPYGSLQMIPRGQPVVGRNLQSLNLQVVGTVEIDSIVVSLGRQGNPGRPTPPPPVQPPIPPARGLELPIQVNQRLSGNGSLELGYMVDLYRYQGYRIEEVVIEATPVYNTALMDLVINSVQQGSTLQFDRRNNYQIVRPYNAVIGRTADRITLFTRGDVTIHRVTLKLGR